MPTTKGGTRRADRDTSGLLGELPELIRQSEEYAAAWRRAGLPGEYLPLPGHDHFSILDELASPDGKLVAALRKLLEQIEALQVRNAREADWSWQEIADALGVSRQAVHKKHARGRLLSRRR